MKNCKILNLITVVLIFATLQTTAMDRRSCISNGPDKQLFLNLLSVEPGNIETMLDGLLVRYNTGYLASTADDVELIFKVDENIASYREMKFLSEEKRPLFQSTDTIFLHINNTSIRDYRFKINMQQFSITGLMAKIEDNYLQRSTLLNTYGANTNVDFSVTADPASADPFRFRIVIITARPLPVTITKFTATHQVGSKNIALEWKVSNQLNMLQYEVERSTDGINFSMVAMQTANTGNSYTYNWADGHAATGNHFYRIRCVDIAGGISYSSIAYVKIDSDLYGIVIYPNPVTNNTIGLQFTNLQKGIYTVKLLNSMGQMLYTTPLNHNGSNSSQTITPPRMMAKGNYYMNIAGPGNLKINKLVSVAR